MDRSSLLVAGVLGLALLAGTVGVTTADERPLADAGLDQSVQQNSTVYLNAGGSVAPDGEIVDYHWVIERPDGTTMDPACPHCKATTFQATNVGVYNATVTVTDDADRTASDTLRVTVAEHTPPDVNVSGPETVTVDDTPSITMNATAGDEPLSSVVWLVDGQQYNASFLDGTVANRSIAPNLSQAGDVVVKARVTDRVGGHAIDRHTIQVENNSNPPKDDYAFETEVTGSYDGVEGNSSVTRHVYVGNTFKIEGISLRVYDDAHPNDKTIEPYPFTQQRAEVLRSTGKRVTSDPHDWVVWGNPSGLDVISRTKTSMTVKAISQQNSTSVSVKLADINGFGYGGYPAIEIREDDDGTPGEP